MFFIKYVWKMKYIFNLEMKRNRIKVFNQDLGRKRGLYFNQLCISFIYCPNTESLSIDVMFEPSSL